MKVDTVIEELCHYYGDVPVVMEAVSCLKEMGRLIQDLSDNIPCCDNCEGKTVFGERTDKCVYEIEGLDSVIYCASRGIANCYGYRKKIDELTADRDHLLKIAKKMHLWIFHHTCDEYAAYKECGLTDEDDVRLGYGGQFVIEVNGENK